jgi:hypothetical protein
VECDVSVTFADGHVRRHSRHPPSTSFAMSSMHCFARHPCTALYATRALLCMPSAYFCVYRSCAFFLKPPVHCVACLPATPYTGVLPLHRCATLAQVCYPCTGVPPLHRCAILVQVCLTHCLFNDLGQSGSFSSTTSNERLAFSNCLVNVAD